MGALGVIEIEVGMRSAAGREHQFALWHLLQRKLVNNVIPWVKCGWFYCAQSFPYGTVAFKS